jgi:pSer/pThr/pTyr-binding forkhead associated (FHA) protein
MAILTLVSDDGSKQYAAGPTTTIGRLHDNMIVIDGPAVSGHHACVFSAADEHIVEDLQSTNGTFVNGARVSRKTLQHGDVVKIGNHELVFDRLAELEMPSTHHADAGASTEQGTVFIDRRTLLDRLVQSEKEARKQDAMLARLNDVEAARSRRDHEAPASVGRLRVVAGNSDCEDYALDAHTSVVGKGKSSLVRLRGWFKPKVSVVITRNRQGYVATVLARDVLINNRPTIGRHELKNGDVLTFGALILEFSVPQAAVAEPAAQPFASPIESGMDCWM